MNSLKQIACIAVVALALYGGYSLLVPHQGDNNVSNEFMNELEAEGIYLTNTEGENGKSALFNSLEGAPSLSGPKLSGSSAVPSVLGGFSDPAPKYGANADLDDAPSFGDAPAWNSDAAPTDEVPAWDADDLKLLENESNDDNTISDPLEHIPYALPEPDLFNLDLTTSNQSKPVASIETKNIQNPPQIDAQSAPLPWNEIKPKPDLAEQPISNNEPRVIPLPGITSNDEDFQTRLSNQPGNRVSADMFTSKQPDKVPTPKLEINTSYNQRAPINTSTDDLVQHLPEVEDVPEMVLANDSTQYADPFIDPLLHSNRSRNTMVSGSTLSNSDLSAPISSESFEIVDDSIDETLGSIPNFDAMPNFEPLPNAVAPSTKPSTPGVANSSQAAARDSSNAPLPTDGLLLSELKEKSETELFDRLNHTTSIDPLKELDDIRIEEHDLITVDRNIRVPQPESPKPEITKNTIRTEIVKKIENIREVLNDENVDFRIGHRLATELYLSDLYPGEREMLLSLVGECGWTAFFSRSWTPLDSALYVVEPNDTLQSIASKRRVSGELIMKINGLQTPVLPPPGTQLKAPQGPFHAVVSMSSRELILTSEGLFACRFKLGIGKKDEIPLTMYEVIDKFADPAYDGPVKIESKDPRNPLGTHWIGLTESIGFHGTNDPNCIGTDNAPVDGFSLSNRDVAELYDILTLGSKITVRQ